MDSVWFVRSAYARHSAWTGQSAQIFFASWLDPPTGGWKSSGSVSAQRASATHGSGVMRLAIPVHRVLAGDALTATTLSPALTMRLASTTAAVP